MGAEAPAALLPYQERIVAEKADLEGKIDRLKAFMETPLHSKNSQDEQERMKNQLHHMTEYAKILGSRIAAFAV